MTTSIQPLTENEKKAIRRVFYIRLVFFFIFLFPLSCGVLYIVYVMLLSFPNHDFDFGTLIGLATLALVVFFCLPYFLPLYRDTFRNLRATEKKVVETRIIHAKLRLTSKGIRRYIIETEFNVIDSWKNVMIMPGSIFPKLHTGNLIQIHFIHNSKLDILHIEKITLGHPT